MLHNTDQPMHGHAFNISRSTGFVKSDFFLQSGQAMGHRGSPCGHALSPAHAMPRPLSSVSRPGYRIPDTWDPTPDTWDLAPDTWDLRPATRDRRPVATGTPVDPVVRAHVLLPVPIPRIFSGFAALDSGPGCRGTARASAPDMHRPACDARRSADCPGFGRCNPHTV